MKRKVFGFLAMAFLSFITHQASALSSGDVNVKMISGYLWMDNACTSGGPLGKVVAFRIKNTKGSTINNLSVSLGSISFTAAGVVSYTSGTPSFLCRTGTSVYIGNLAASDSATAYFYVGYNCLFYPNNTNLTTDYVTFPLSLADNGAGTVSKSFQTNIYVLRNANNNTITVLATSSDAIGGITTISIAYNISNVKPGNIIDMELSTLNTFPAGYSILGCKITSTNIPSDFALNAKDMYYTSSALSNMSSGGNVTIEWYLKIEGSSTGINSSNINPYIVSDAGSAQRWQATTTSFTGTSTPVNKLSMSKRVNTPNVFVNDTVVYTIVIKNSSTTADLTIDQLVDVLPRDYQFLHMETNVGVYPKLVTYSNCTQYPSYQKTGTLTFMGHAELTPGTFSWIIPKNDSIKLIYSAKVSSVVGIKDTNKIAAYVGATKVASSFSVVNVFTTLPVEIIYFKADALEDHRVMVSWVTATETNCKNYILERQLVNGEAYTTIANMPAARNSKGNVHYEWPDMIPSGNMRGVVYKLTQYDYNGRSVSYYATIRKGFGNEEYRMFRYMDNYIAINASNNSTGEGLLVKLSDITGRTLYSGGIEKTEGLFVVPYNLSSENGHIILVTIEQDGMIVSVQRILID